MAATDAETRAELLRLAETYSWDVPPAQAVTIPDRIVRRVMDVGTWDDVLAMERVFGRAKLHRVIARAEAGSLRPKSWSFWHYRLGLVEPGGSVPAMPVRRLA